MTTLPKPDIDAEHHSEKLTQIIRQAILDAGGFISFARYMELALYAPGYGYYSAGARKFGKTGDFVTAPEISPLFGQCLGRQCSQILAELEAGDILEIGAGAGTLAKDIMLSLERTEQLPRYYYILEISAELRARQKDFLTTEIPHLIERVIWLDQLPKHFNGIIIANEVMDALPTHCFAIQDNNLIERGVTWINDQFQWVHAAPSNELAQHIEQLKQDIHFPSHYASETNLMLPGWIRSLADSLNKGVILLLDYGYGRQEYYHPDRTQGTLMCFYRHHKHQDPFFYPGLQDITAHVDFTSVIENAAAEGLSLAGYTTQTAFLLATGILELAAATHLSTAAQYHQSQAIKTLTLPAQMGEAIKVMGLAKEYDTPLLGFTLHDRSRDL